MAPRRGHFFNSQRAQVLTLQVLTMIGGELCRDLRRRRIDDQAALGMTDNHGHGHQHHHGGHAAEDEAEKS